MQKNNSILLLLLLLTLSCQKKSEIKNIILLIGDGMGIQQLNMGHLYLGHATKSPYSKKQLSLFKHTKHLSLSLTKPHNHLVVDSACSATQLATGEVALSESIGVSSKGESPQTILELASKLGKSTALLSNTRMTHATPASFASHTTSRFLENEIAEQLVNSPVDILVSGGLRHFVPANHKKDENFQSYWRSLIDVNYAYSSKRKDNKNLLQIAKDNGFEVSFTANDYFSSNAKKHLVFMGNSAMPSAIDLASGEISIPEITKQTLSKLAKNPEGFFMMVEEGQIDWAGHANDAGTLLHEVLQMDRTFEAIYEWAKDRDDTLVIVTADHETGGFGFSYKTRNNPDPTNYPGTQFQDRKFSPRKHYGNYNQLDLIHSQKTSYGKALHLFLNDDPNADKLCALIKEISHISLSSEICKNIWSDYQALAPLSNKKDADHYHLEFFHNFTGKNEMFANLVAKALSPYLNTTWGTGSHTSTPVGVFVWGPEDSLEKFPEIMTHAQLGKTMKSFFQTEQK